MAAVIAVVLGMAALAIDLTALYVFHGEAQRAADAAALAAAKMFASSGFTAGQINESAACVSSASGPGSGAANAAAQSTASANLVAGQPPQIASITCTYSSSGGDQNPQVTVKVQQGGLPSYFARIWGQTMNSVTATATAEAYNPSGPPGISPVQVSIKPFLVPNCMPSTTATTICPGTYFIDPNNNNALNNPAAYLGQEIYLAQVKTNGTVPFPPLPPQPYAAYYIIRPPQEATICPSRAAPPGTCAQVGGGGTYDNIACSEEPTRLPPPTTDEGEQLSCGDQLRIRPSTGTPTRLTETSNATQCLTHASGPGLGMGQDVFNPGNVVTGLPVEIDAGASNPNSTLAGALTKNVSRSDSVITVPLFDSRTNACPGGVCQPVTITGFLQLGVQSVDGNGTIQAVVMNASGCGSNAGSGTTISASGVSPVPVRLIGQ